MIYTFLTLLQSTSDHPVATINHTLSSISQSIAANILTVADIEHTLSPISQEVEAALVATPTATIEHTLSPATQSISASIEIPIVGSIRHSLSAPFQNVIGQLRISIPFVPKEPEEIFTEDHLRFSVMEIYRGDFGFDLLQKLANHLKVELNTAGIPRNVQITRDGFVAEAGRYVIHETASGLLVGLFKSVGGVMKPLSPGFPNEIRILQGRTGVELIPPAGWEIVRDEAIQARYNMGNSPNWVTAVIRYVGI